MLFKADAFYRVDRWLETGKKDCGTRTVEMKWQRTGTLPYGNT